MKTQLLLTTFLIIFSIQVYSSEEDYFGKYSSVNKGIKVKFTLNEEGVLNLLVDSINIDVKTLTYDYLAIYGNAQVFQINFSDNENYSNIIKLFIVKNNGEFVITTGYYLRYKSDDKGNIIVNKKQALELTCKNL